MIKSKPRNSYCSALVYYFDNNWQSVGKLAKLPICAVSRPALYYRLTSGKFNSVLEALTKPARKKGESAYKSKPKISDKKCWDILNGVLK